MKCLNPDLINERRFWRFFNDEAEKYNLVFRPYSVKENKNEGYSLQIYDLLNADGKGKKLYENSFFFDKEIEKGGGRGLFGLYSSAFKDVSFIDSVISSIANLDKKVIKGDKVLIENLENLTGFLQGLLYKYRAYNRDPTLFKYVLEQNAMVAYMSESKRVNTTVVPYGEDHIVNVCLTTEGEPFFECNASDKNIGNSFCREFRKALRQRRISEKSPLRKLYELENGFYCQGISDRLLDILDENNIEIMDILGVERKGDLTAVLQLPDDVDAKKVVYTPNNEQSFVSSFRKVCGCVH